MYIIKVFLPGFKAAIANFFWLVISICLVIGKALMDKYDC